jgi:ribonuclease HI
MVHVFNKGNKVARGFAKLGHKAATLRLWHGIPPKSSLRHLEQDASELREEDEQSCLVAAGWMATPTTPVASTESKLPNLKSVPSSSIWMTPKKGRLKLNFDGSSKSNGSSIGGVYRDHKGKFILGYAQGISRVTSSVAELVALKRGLQLAVKKGWTDISIEGDFKPGIDAIASRAPFRAKKDLGQYMEIAAMLPLLGKTTMSHVLRKGNRVAHYFAELGHEAAPLRLWHHIPPDKVLQQLEEDAPKVYYPRRQTSWHCLRRTFPLKLMLLLFRNRRAPRRRAASTARQGGCVAPRAKR